MHVTSYNFYLRLMTISTTIDNFNLGPFLPLQITLTYFLFLILRKRKLD